MIQRRSAFRRKPGPEKKSEWMKSCTRRRSHARVALDLLDCLRSPAVCLYGTSHRHFALFCIIGRASSQTDADAPFCAPAMGLFVARRNGVGLLFADILFWACQKKYAKRDAGDVLKYALSCAEKLVVPFPLCGCRSVSVNVKRSSGGPQNRVSSARHTVQVVSFASLNI